MWKKELEEFLRCNIRYLFDTKDGKYPDFVEQYFTCTMPSENEEYGFLERFSCLVDEMRRRCFFAGYQLGSKDTYEDIADIVPAVREEVKFESDMNWRGAQKQWYRDREENF